MWVPSAKDTVLPWLSRLVLARRPGHSSSSSLSVSSSSSCPAPRLMLAAWPNLFVSGSSPASSSSGAAGSICPSSLPSTGLRLARLCSSSAPVVASSASPPLPPAPVAAEPRETRSSSLGEDGSCPGSSTAPPIAPAVPSTTSFFAPTGSPSRCLDAARTASGSLRVSLMFARSKDGGGSSNEGPVRCAPFIRRKCLRDRRMRCLGEQKRTRRMIEGVGSVA
mmetsp:Transcript_27840/g.81494  ORF Transcript_27840/g.81494 Transcript_27840/m.81494 type:complete len:222 (-) Transcript_27840:3374-4039(-)